MTIFLAVLYILSSVAILVGLILMVRNEQVYRFRMRVLDRSHFVRERGVFIPYHNMTDYKTMVNQPWRPLKSYLPPEYRNILDDPMPLPPSWKKKRLTNMMNDRD